MSLNHAVLLANAAIAPTGQLVLAVFMWRRGLLRRMPWFFTYTVWVMAWSPVLTVLYLQAAVLRTTTPALFYTGWVTQAVSVALGFAVVYEVFVQVFQPYETFRRLAPALFRWCGVGLLLVGSAGALLSSPDRSLRVVAGLLILQRTLRVVQVGLLLLVLVTGRFLHIPWRRDVLGVALGFGMYAAVSIVVSTLQAQNGPVAFQALNMVDGTAYTCAVSIWVAYCLAPQLAAQPAKVTLQSNTDVEQWNQALSHLLQQ